ncbi:S-adenosyl-L-methionine-dependent methyltransferase [Cercophora scortea]|uniref:S-adenosyl-L-methionine-dependent methyltransferase n=1 Tax=Cercophora scortea TaxID=314031 RepID=A0AAE0IVX7_9PEZI|nr:S-adenosyl-L-methionine-dependent methyltransferase [Cercophora scortea]
MCDELRSIPGAEVQQCDAAHLPFATASFDTVIANHMLYHVDDPAAAVAELCRVLRPGGRLFVALNGLDHLQELFDIGDAIGRPSVIRQQARVTAETAEPLLAASHLADVSHERFPGAFEVAEPGPVVAYLGSVGDGPLSPEQEQVVRTAVASRIEKEGTFRVTKNMVLFSGRKE